MAPLNIALFLWKIGLVSSESLVAWVDSKIISSVNPEHELVELSLNGPDVCLKRPSYDFLARPAPLSFSDEFCLRAAVLDVFSEDTANAFVEWATCYCMGENIEDPLVMFCYELEDLWGINSDSKAQIVFLRKNLPLLMPRCLNTANTILSQVRDLKLNYEVRS
jgi:hypothetical protein